MPLGWDEFRLKLRRGIEPDPASLPKLNLNKKNNCSNFRGMDSYGEAARGFFFDSLDNVSPIRPSIRADPLEGLNHLFWIIPFKSSNQKTPKKKKNPSKN